MLSVQMPAMMARRENLPLVATLPTVLGAAMAGTVTIHRLVKKVSPASAASVRPTVMETHLEMEIPLAIPPTVLGVVMDGTATIRPHVKTAFLA